jgi:S-adenosylmethionine decarboxylase
MGEGRHIKMVGIGDPLRLGNVGVVETLLKEIVDKLKMRPLSGPHMCDVEHDIKKLGVEPFEDEGGVTGVLVLSTSHVSIHTWPLRKWFVLDVYSCRDFDTKLLSQYVQGFLATEKVRVSDLSDSLLLTPPIS